ncbi:Lztr1 [Symbiodinium sp. CCMP2592]|nr:Lztr1 [Symbiodinium sp. CCMP2592]
MPTYAISQLLFLCWCWRVRGEWGRLADLTDAAGHVRPAARSEHIGAWDESRQVLQIHAGSNLEGDLWAFDVASATWTRTITAEVPAARSAHAAGWDPAGQSLWVHGGYNSQTKVWFRDIWRFQSGLWTLESNDAGPCGRQAHVAVWVASTSSLWVHGGWTGTHRLSDLWSYNQQAHGWQELAPLSPSGAPPARSHHIAVWDGTNQVLWMHGGYNSSLLGDLWTLDATTLSWAEIQSDGGPTARSGHAAVWDVESQLLWLHGGNDGILKRDLWRYDPESNIWSLIAEQAGPSGRWSHVAAWDDLNHVIYIHGGYNGSLCGDLWSFWVTTTSTTQTASSTSSSSSQTSTSSSISRTSSSSSSSSSSSTSSASSTSTTATSSTSASSSSSSTSSTSTSLTSTSSSRSSTSHTSSSSSISQTSSSSSSSTTTSGTSTTGTSSTSMSTTSSSTSSSSSSRTSSSTGSTTVTLTSSTSFTQTISTTSATSTSRTFSTVTFTSSSTTTATTTTTTQFVVFSPWPDWLLAVIIGAILLMSATVCTFSALEAIHPFISFPPPLEPRPSAAPERKGGHRSSPVSPVFPRLLGSRSPCAPLVVLVHFQGATRVTPRICLVPESTALQHLQPQATRNEPREPQATPKLLLPASFLQRHSSKTLPDLLFNSSPQDVISFAPSPAPAPSFASFQSRQTQHAQHLRIRVRLQTECPKQSSSSQACRSWPRVELVREPPAWPTACLSRRDTQPCQEPSMLPPLPRPSAHAPCYMCHVVQGQDQYLPFLPPNVGQDGHTPRPPPAPRPTSPPALSFIRLEPPENRPRGRPRSPVSPEAQPTAAHVAPSRPRVELVPKSRVVLVTSRLPPDRPLPAEPQTLSPKSRWLGFLLGGQLQGQQRLQALGGPESPDTATQQHPNPASNGGFDGPVTTANRSHAAASQPSSQCANSPVDSSIMQEHLPHPDSPTSHTDSRVARTQHTTLPQHATLRRSRSEPMCLCISPTTRVQHRSTTPNHQLLSQPPYSPASTLQPSLRLVSPTSNSTTHTAHCAQRPNTDSWIRPDNGSPAFTFGQQRASLPSRMRCGESPGPGAYNAEKISFDRYMPQRLEQFNDRRRIAKEFVDKQKRKRKQRGGSPCSGHQSQQTKDMSACSQ